MVAVYFHLAWKVKYEVLSACFRIYFLYLSYQPVYISLQEFHAINHAAIRSKFVLLHDFFQADELLYVNSTL